MPVLWLCGPAGVGKSTVSWQLFTELTDAGVPAGFADTDQLCMCYPAPPGDPGRERIKAQNLDAVIANYQAAGTRCLIVNGVVNPAVGVLRELLPHAAISVCRLRADRDEIARRLVERQGPSSDLDKLITDTLAEADGLDASDFADACVDTTGVPAAKVAALVRESCPDWPGFLPSGSWSCVASVVPGTAACSDRDVSHRRAGNILLICGPTGIGKSTIGFQLHLRNLRGGLTAGYVDLDQLAFISASGAGDCGRHELKARNLAAIWQTNDAAGARHLVATGAVQDEASFRYYTDALPGATVTLCRLDAGRAELTRRVLSRGAGGSWPQPGDPLRGQPDAYLRQVADQAAADAERLERARFGTLRIDTDGHTPAEAAELIAAMTPGQAERSREPAIGQVTSCSERARR